MTNKQLHCTRCLSPLILCRDGWVCSTGCSVVAERWMTAARLFRRGWIVDPNCRCTRCDSRLIRSWVWSRHAHVVRWCPGCGPEAGPNA